MRQHIDVRWQRWIQRRVPKALRVELDQRKVFIFPTRYGFFFLLTSFLLFLGGINYENSLILNLSFFLVSLFLVAILQTFKNLSGLVLVAGETKPAFKGQDAWFEILFERESTRQYESLHVIWEGQESGSINVIERTKQPVGMSLRAIKRGRYSPGRFKVQSTFPLGLLRTWSWVQLDIAAIVYPMPVRCEYVGTEGDGKKDGNIKTPTGQDEFEYLSNKIHELGFDIYISDYEHLDVYACRILVPGMSDIYPVDELVWENNNEGALFREDLLTLKDAGPAKWQDILTRLEEGGYHDQTLVAQFIGLAPDPDTLWAQIRLGEIKTMLSLALQDEQALDWIDWCLALDQAGEASLRLYRCVKALLEIKWQDGRDYADYEQGLALMYGQQNVIDGMAIVEAKTVFHNLHCPGLSLEGFERHNMLLAGYEKLQQAKRNNWK